MKPNELEKLEVLESAELSGDIPNAFMKLWRYCLRHIYTENRVSREYNFDLLVTKFSDAVVVVPYCRHKDGRIIVALRYGTRPAVYLRSRHTKTNEDIRSPVFCELVAGGVEDSDYSELDGIRNRAAKEVFEEAGFLVRPSQLIDLGAAAFTAPGFAIEKLHFFCVEVDLSQRQDSMADDTHEEVGALEFREISDALTMCRTGQIADQKTEVALFRFASLMGLIPGFGLNGRDT
jgi:ADP-ribose pyrophosphatase